MTHADDQLPPRHNYLETVLSSPIPVAKLETIRAYSEAEPGSAHGGPLPQLTLPVGQPRYRVFEMEQDNKARFPVVSHNSPNGMFCIDCNNCSRSIANEHYHCSICEGGDYDLCAQCVDAGASCHGDEHWLIKRVVMNGVVTNSTTETIPSRSSSDVQDSKPASTAVPSQQQPVAEQVPDLSVPAAPSAVNDPRVEMQDVPKPMCNGCCLGMYKFSSVQDCRLG